VLLLVLPLYLEELLGMMLGLFGLTEAPLDFELI